MPGIVLRPSIVPVLYSFLNASSMPPHRPHTAFCRSIVASERHSSRRQSPLVRCSECFHRGGWKLVSTRDLFNSFVSSSRIHYRSLSTLPLTHSFTHSHALLVYSLTLLCIHSATQTAHTSNMSHILQDNRPLILTHIPL